MYISLIITSVISGVSRNTNFVPASNNAKTKFNQRDDQIKYGFLKNFISVKGVYFGFSSVRVTFTSLLSLLILV